jgi:DNA mismatch repair protein MutS
MVEMQETANILDAATEKSLVILDEIGRGTSTYDGMSIAWAIMEYLHDKLTSKTLFATHYHELISLADKLQHAANYSVAVKDDSKDGVVFLYKILRGGVDKSYGIEVAKLAGLPDEVIAKARKILVDLEEGVLESGIQHELQTTRPVQDQVSLFEREHSSLKAVADEVKKIDVNSLTPLDALQKLHQIKIKLTQDHANN